MVLSQTAWEQEADCRYLPPTARPWSLVPSGSHCLLGTPGWANLHLPILLGGTAVPICVGLSHRNAGWSLGPLGPKAGAMGRHGAEPPTPRGGPPWPGTPDLLPPQAL